MWVSSIEINNIKSFEASGTINLDRKMNILLGANNSGKSTILRVLYLIQNANSLTPSDVRIGAAPNASCFVKLENVDNVHITNMVSQGYKPALYILGSRGGSLQAIMEMQNSTQRASVSIPA